MARRAASRQRWLPAPGSSPPAADVLGALVVGSLAAGSADASDVDLIICTRPGRFAGAWARRHDLHAARRLAAADA